MRLDRTDRFVATAAAILIVMLIGMLGDLWYLAFAGIPTLSVVLMLMGSRRIDGRVVRSWPVLGYSVVLCALFTWVGVVMNSTEPTFGELRPGMGVIFYVLWPFVSLASGLVYALVTREPGDIDEPRPRH